jgi:hypothetical protein
LSAISLARLSSLMVRSKATNNYISFLNDHFLPYLDALTDDGITGVSLQQDSARPHTSKIPQAFLKTATTQHGLIVMDDWPSYFPAMNLIENLSAHVKIELHRRYSDTAILCGSPQYIRLRNTERLREIW